ncbi:MAG TPA: 30S ribosomal protein S21 [Candidatus Paceibacterota bacterium]
MAINAEVQKSGNETALSTIRKFSRRVQGTGLIRTVRAARYFSRDTSKTVRKKRALKLLKRRAEYKLQIKEGKITELTGRRGGINRGSGFSAHTARPASQTPSARIPQAVTEIPTAKEGEGSPTAQ